MRVFLKITLLILFDSLIFGCNLGKSGKEETQDIKVIEEIKDEIIEEIKPKDLITSEFYLNLDIFVEADHYTDDNGKDSFCLEGVESEIIFNPIELGSKEWDGDSYWIEGYDKKIRLLGIDYPDIKGPNDLHNCTSNKKTQNCQNWFRAFGPKLNLDKIEKCYWKGMDELQVMLKNRAICVIEDKGNPIHPFGNLLRYFEFEQNGKIIDFSRWLIEQGYAIPWDDKSDYGNCERCDEYQELSEKHLGCLWN